MLERWLMVYADFAVLKANVRMRNMFLPGSGTESAQTHDFRGRMTIRNLPRAPLRGEGKQEQNQNRPLIELGFTNIEYIGVLGSDSKAKHKSRLMHRIGPDKSRQVKKQGSLSGFRRL